MKPAKLEDGSLAGKHILIIGIYYHPEETGIAPYTTDLAEYLAIRGMKVTVLAGIPHYPKWRAFEGYGGRLWNVESINGVEVRRLRTFIPHKQSALKRAAYEVTFAGHLISLRKTLCPDMILGVVPNLSGGLVAAAAGRRFGRPFGLWVQDLTGPAALQSGIAGGGKVASITSKLEGYALRAASGVAIASEGFQPYLVAHGVRPDRLEFLPNWAHVESPDCDRLEVRNALGWGPGEIVALHAGNMGLKQELENVIGAAKLADGSKRIRFVFLGNGSQRARLETLAAGLRNVTFMDPVPSQDFVNVLCASDVLLVNERATVTDMSLPSKLTSYFLAGRPVLAAVAIEGATARFLNDTGTGLTVPAGEPQLLLDALNHLLGDPALQAALPTAATNFALEHLTASHSLTKFEPFLTRLMGVG